MTLYNTSLGQATQSHETVIAMRNYEIQQASDYDYCSNVRYARGSISPRAVKKLNGAKIDTADSIRKVKRQKLNLPYFAFGSRS